MSGNRDIAQLKEEFSILSKQVLHRNFSKASRNYITNISLLVKSYNDFVNFIIGFYDESDKDTQNFFIIELNDVRNTLIQCYKKLDIAKEPPEIFELVNENDILSDTRIDKHLVSTNNTKASSTQANPRTTESIASTSNTNTTSLQTSFRTPRDSNDEISTSLGNISVIDIIDDTITDNETTHTNLTTEDGNLTNLTDETEILNTNLTTEAENLNTLSLAIRNSTIPVQDNTNTMAEEKQKYIATASKVVKENYCGDPLALDSFISSIELLEELTEAAHIDLMFKYVKTKLQGKALESIDNTIINIDQLKNALRRNIKPDSSEIVQGKMLAMRLDKTKIQDFSKTAEELADSLKRTYIVEGMTAELATKMTINKTIEMCRASTHSVGVKAVLGACTFTNHKDVIAKLITESATEQQEKQVLAFQRNRNWNNRKNFRRYNNNHNNYRGNSNNNSNNHRNNSNNNRNNNRNQNGNNNRNHNNKSNYRRRGRNNEANVFVAKNDSEPQTINLGGNRQQN